MRRAPRLVPAVLAASLCLPAAGGEWSGPFAVEARLFPHAPPAGGRHGTSLSLSARPEYYRRWNGGGDSFTFAPFLRLDRGDPERSHFDLRELTWLHAERDWELRAGIRRVFWGVTEAVHLVDIINQTDLVENIDTEDRLGQPMINLALIRDWGTVDLFLLPGFRERTFPGARGRLRSEPRVDTGQARFESAAGRLHTDWAVRWSHYSGPWDIALSHFSGTGREPTLLPGVDAAGAPVLIPWYEQIDQSGLTLQAVTGDWLWKLEAISRAGQGDRYTALAGGFERTFTGVFGSYADLGVIGEYLFDDRGTNAPNAFEDDFMLGLRLALNDAPSSELLFGAILDRDSRARFYNLEAARRLGNRWKLSLEARIPSRIPFADPLYGLRSDDYLQLELAWYL